MATVRCCLASDVLALPTVEDTSVERLLLMGGLPSMELLLNVVKLLGMGRCRFGSLLELVGLPPPFSLMIRIRSAAANSNGKSVLG